MSINTKIEKLRSVFRVSSEKERLNSFREIYDENHLYVRRTLFHIVGEQALDDLVQETFLKIWKGLSHFNQASSIRTWIYRISVNTAYDAIRKNRDQISVQLESVAELSHESRPQLDVQEILDRGILFLPEKQRIVFVLFYKEELSLKEISEILQTKEGTIKSRLSLGRKTFVTYLKNQGVQYEE